MVTVVSVTSDLEFKIDGSWTSVKSFLDERSNVSWRLGVGPNRKMQPSSLTFSFTNEGEEWTPSNSTSTYFNKIRQGTEVRLSSTYSGTTRYHFTGEITDINPSYPEAGADDLRCAFTCQGKSAALARIGPYAMTLLTNVDVDDAIAAVLTAAGTTSYSLEDSAYTIPNAFARDNPLTDVVAMAASDPSKLLWEDGQGRMRLKSMIGGYSSPDQTWGADPYAPREELRPDYRKTSQFARQVVRASVLTPSITPVTLYEHPLSAKNGAPEKMAGYAYRKLAGEFAKFPYTVVTQFQQTIVPFLATTDPLSVSMDASQTTVTTSSAYYNTTNTFQPGDYIRIHNEIMLVTAAVVIAYGQRLTVTRAQLGTTAAVHAAVVPGGTPIYKRSVVEVLTQITPPYNSLLNQSVGASSSSWNITNAAPLAVNDLLKCDSEIVKVTSIVGAPIYGVQRAMNGTTAASHALNAQVNRWATQGVTGNLGASYILGSDVPGGVPAVSPDISGNSFYAGGAHIAVYGRKFLAAFSNNSAADRYLAALVIGGTELTATDTPIELVYEKAVPYLFGITEGEALAIPYGVGDVAVAKGYGVGSLRAGRVPTPWLPSVKFTANLDTSVANLLAAAANGAGDLVRYTGTGQWREEIDDFYRTLGVAGRLDALGVFHFDFALAPAHVWRDPGNCAYTDFGWNDYDNIGLGDLMVKPVGSSGWTNDTAWTTTAGAGGWGPSGPVGNKASGTGNKPAEPLIAIGADLVVGASITEPFPANNSYAADSGGVGICFRANAGNTERWEVRLNRSQTKVYLWNVADGRVAQADWTPTTGAEIEVRAQGSLIQVFVDLAPEPLIRHTSTRYLTNTYAGLELTRTPLFSSGQGIYHLDFYAQKV